jgi:GGDEF domain-containing protein
MVIDQQYSHDGLRDELTLCAAPPLFYSHLDRVIAGSTRANSVISLVAISISNSANIDAIVSMAHVITQSMRREDLCGRMGHYQFVIAMAGDSASAVKLVERIEGAAKTPFSSAYVEWIQGEKPLQFLYRLDCAVESD